MSIVYRGDGIPRRQSFGVYYDSSSGYTYEQQFAGHDLAAIEALANQFNFFGIDTHLRFEAGRATLMTRDATRAVPIDRWEIAVEQEQPSIFENQFYVPLIEACSDPSTFQTMIREALENHTKWSTLLDDTVFSVLLSDLTSGQQDQLQQFFDDYNKGVTNFIRGKNVLRHTTNAPNRWNVNIADFNVEKIYTISQLLSEINDPSLWIFPCPGYLRYKIATYEAPIDRPHYLWGALKTRSNAVTCGNNRVEITTEYLIDQINTNVYAQI